MSEDMHIPMSRPSRVERTTTSCGECRRRKQRCNQGRPCSNCARRFPPPPCEYKTIGRRQISPSNFNAQPMTLSPIPSLYADPTFDLPGAYEPYPPRHISPLPPQWTGSPSLENGEAIRWSGIDLLTQFPPSVSSPSPNPWELSLSWPVPTGGPESRQVSPCGNGSTSEVEDVNAAMQLMQASQGMFDPFMIAEYDPSRGAEEAMAWFTIPENQTSSRSLWPVGNSPMEELLDLPAPPTQQDADLLKIFVRTLAPFSAALDGNAESTNAYLKHYVPFVLQSPLLTQTAIYTSACFLHETGHMDKSTAMAHKTQAIGLLNEHIWSGSSSSDEVIAAHIQLILNEWYWGAGTDLGAHLRGLREMIRVRGGLRSLGLHGLIAKMAVTTDISISLSNSTPPILPVEPFDNTPRLPLRLSLNTPLLSSLPRFSACAEALKLDPATAAVLDDMRFLISAVLALPDGAGEKELSKVKTTGAWIYNRILGLPDHAPGQGGGGDDGGGYAGRVGRTPSIVVTDESGSPGLGGGGFGRRGSWQSGSSAGSYTDEGRAESGELQQHSPTQPTQIPPHPTHPPPPLSQQPDPLYQSVRLAALLYARAITTRQPFATTVSENEFIQLWRIMWRVPLTTWKGVLGVFNWILLPIAPVARGTRHGRFVKSMGFNGALQMGVDNWGLAGGGMEAGVRLGGWLDGHGHGI